MVRAWKTHQCYRKKIFKIEMMRKNQIYFDWIQASLKFILERRKTITQTNKINCYLVTFSKILKTRFSLLESMRSKRTINPWIQNYRQHMVEISFIFIFFINNSLFSTIIHDFSRCFARNFPTFRKIDLGGLQKCFLQKIYIL